MDTNHVDAIRVALKKDFDAIGFGDGHSVVDPKMYISAGIPKEVIDPITREFKPDGSPKGIMNECTGVHHLEFLEMAANALGADTSVANRMHGRGSQAQALSKAISVALR